MHRQFNPFPLSLLPLTARHPLQALRVLDLSFNEFSSTYALPRAESLQALSLMRNLVPATHLAMRGLARYKKLTSLTLGGNPISATGSLYMHLVAWAVPHVTSLDGRPFVNPRAGRADERGWLGRLVPVWMQGMLGGWDSEHGDDMSNSDLFSPRPSEQETRAAERRGGGEGVGESGRNAYMRSPSGLLTAMRRASFRGSSVQLAGGHRPHTVRVQQALPSTSLYLISQESGSRAL